MQGQLTTGAQTLTAAGAVTPSTGLDISGITGDYTVSIEVLDLHSASGVPKAQIALEDSVNAFTASRPCAVVDVTGPVVAPVQMSRSKYEMPSLRAGTASAVLRLNVIALGGTTPSITLRAVINY